MRLTLRKNIVFGVGIGLILGASIGLLGIWAQKEQDVAPMTGDCIMAGCHNTESNEASFHLTVNQEAIQPGMPVKVEAGRSIELDFYFENIVGKRKNVPVIGSVFSKSPHRSVGVELIMEPGWIVTVGTVTKPDGWNNIWQRGASGTVEEIATGWQQVDDVSGHYYLNFENSSWRTFPDLPAVASDTGLLSTGDLDSTAGMMGADCIIRTSPETPTGTYPITVAGVGHDNDGRQAHVAQTILVEVVNSKVTISNPNFILYQSLCSSCHGKTPEEIGKLLKNKPDQIARIIKWGKDEMEPIRGLEESQISEIIDYILSTADKEFAFYPFITHPAEEGQNCLSCHEPNGIVPVPEGHKAYANNMCFFCHEVLGSMANVVTTRVPHPVEGRPCLVCHDTDRIVPVSSSHVGRGDNLCLSCHQIEDDMAGIEIPEALHRVTSDILCSSCHSFGTTYPMPQNHEGYSEYICIACHESDPDVIASIPPIAHGIDGRGACLACHSPSGWEPAPADHIDRTVETCLICHY